jgi:uncharacterized protein (DUF1810 family)
VGNEKKDPFDLERFILAQEDVYERALAELRNGRKRSHWMWFIFPQIAGLGRSEASVRYAIGGLDEASAYLVHPLLGSRLLECCEALLSHKQLSAAQIFGSPDDMKLHSSMTLFDVVSTHSVFDQVLNRYFRAQRDKNTLQILRKLA